MFNKVRTSAWRSPLPHHMRRHHASLIPQNHQREQPFRQAVGVVHAPGEFGRGGPVEYGEVGFVAGLEVADVVVQVEGAGAAQGGEIPAAHGGEGRAVDLAGLVGLAEGADQAEAGAAAHVGGEAHAQAGGGAGGVVEGAAAEEEVGGGAEGGCGAAGGHLAALGVGEVDAVAVDR